MEKIQLLWTRVGWRPQLWQTKSFEIELEQDDTLRRAEVIAEKLGRVAQGMEAMVEAMTDLNEEDSESNL